MQAVHKEVGITLTDLTPNVRENVELMAEATVLLETKDSSPNSHSLALSELLRREAALTAEVGEASEYVGQLREEIRTITIDNAHLSRTLRELDEEAKAGASSLSKKKRDTNFLRQKSEQYKKQVAALEAELTRNGYVQEIQHPVLLQRYKELQSLQNELGVISKQLESYADLPPNLDLARVKVEEGKQEVARLEAELSQNIDLIHAEN